MKRRYLNNKNNNFIYVNDLQEKIQVIKMFIIHLIIPESQFYLFFMT